MEKRIRKITEHIRSKSKRPVRVRSYYQRYDKPRGQITKLRVDSITATSRTVWLKDAHGKFIGRANSKGETRTAKNKIAKFNIDRTQSIRDANKYKRVFGRAPSSQ